jgi:hypothetical protein
MTQTNQIKPAEAAGEPIPGPRGEIVGSIHTGS